MLWGNVDNAANSAIFALAQVRVNTANSTERTNLYDNTTADTYFPGATVGQFGVDTSEVQALNESDTGEHPTHAGWNLRTVGSGGRAGRVFYETLVAMGSMSDDGSDDTQLPDAYIRITSQPSNATANSTLGQHAYFTVGATITPSTATLAYKWQYNNSGVMTNITDGAVYANSTTATLDVKNTTGLNGQKYRCVLTSTGAVTAVTSNGTLTVVT